MAYIFSSFFTKKIHPQSIDPSCIGVGKDGFVKPEASYMQKWADSVDEDWWQPYVFHDGLPEEVKKQFPHVTFVEIDRTYSQYSNNDARYMYYNDFCQSQAAFTDTNCSEDSLLFTTDISDVVVVGGKKPEDLCFKNGNDKFSYFCGGEGKSLYRYQPSYCGSVEEAYKGLKLELPSSVSESTPLINMGVVGGKVTKMIKFFPFIKNVITTRGVPHLDINMEVGNFCLRLLEEEDDEKILVGEPVTSNYKSFENDREDVWFIHK